MQPERPAEVPGARRASTLDLTSSDETQQLAALAIAVRESSLKRLKLVPAGEQNWRPARGAMSFAELARHLVEADDWLLRKLRDPSLKRMAETEVGERAVDWPGFQQLLDRLGETGRIRSHLISRLTKADLSVKMPDERFGGEVSAWWVIVRGNLDHEAHHRGQLATYLRCLAERRSLEAHDK